MSIFKRPKKKKQVSFKSNLPDYITGRDPSFTYTTHTRHNEDGTKKFYFSPVRKHTVKVEKVFKIDGKDSNKWFLKI